MVKRNISFGCYYFGICSMSNALKFPNTFAILFFGTMSMSSSHSYLLPK
jgi:hypothetical protein